MSKPQTLGKINKDFFEKVIFPHLGAARPEILQGPQMGLDNGIIKIAESQVMAVTTDPLSYIPELGPEDSAKISVQLLANDLTTSGLKPAYAIMSFNLPHHISSDDFESYWQATHKELSSLGIAVIAGHTGRYGSDPSTIIGSGALMAIGPESDYLATGMAGPGDLVLLTKGAMPATCGLLARVFAQTIKKKFGSKFLKEAQALLQQYSTVREAQRATSVGIHQNGVTAMHDATEGGIFGALYELAAAARCGLYVEAEKIPVAPEVRAICGLFGLDPYRSLSEGALLISARPDRAEEIIQALRSEKIAAAVIGELRPESEKILISESGRALLLEPPAEDAYWRAYQLAKERGWQ